MPASAEDKTEEDHAVQKRHIDIGLRMYALYRKFRKT